MSETPTITLNENTRIRGNVSLLGNSELGDVLVSGYRTALELDERLSDMQVVPIIGDETFKIAFARPKWSNKNSSGNHEIHIRLGTVDDELSRIENAMQKVPTACKVIADRIGIDPDELSPKTMYAFSVFHEMGHVIEYFDNESDPAHYQLQLKRDKLALPIGKASALALATPDTVARLHVENHWQQVVESMGVKSIEDLIHMQAVAYRDMPSEAAADKFAVDVIHGNPGMIDGLR